MAMCTPSTQTHFLNATTTERNYSSLEKGLVQSWERKARLSFGMDVTVPKSKAELKDADMSRSPGNRSEGALKKWPNLG